MINGKSPTAQRPLVFALAALLCWFCVEGPANAQKMMTSSAWRTQTIDTNIPKGTKIRVRTIQPINYGICDRQSFQGVVDRDVTGDMGQVLVPKGAPVELTAQAVSNNQLALYLNSVVTNDELFGARGSQEEGLCISTSAQPSSNTSARTYVSTQQCNEVPADTLVTFRLNVEYVRVK